MADKLLACQIWLYCNKLLSDIIYFWNSKQTVNWSDPFWW